MNDYMNEDESKPILNIGPSKNWVKTSLVVAFDTFGSIIEGVGNQFDWGISGEMDKIMTNYKAALAQDLTEEPIDI